MRPNTIVTRPSGLNRTTMSEPLSATQMLSLLIDAHGMRERPGVEIVADLAQELSVGVELEQLRGRGTVGRACGVAARKDEDMLLGIDGDAGDLAEVHVGRKFKKSGTDSNAISGG